MEETYNFQLNKQQLTDLLDILSDLYTSSPESRQLLRTISKQTNEHTEIVAEMDHEFPDEKE